MKIINIKLTKWDKFNPRKDQKNYTWFRFQNDFFSNENFIELNDQERLAWIYILCIASQKNESCFDINLLHAKRIAQIDSKNIENCLKKLEILGICSFTCNDCTDTSKSTCNDNPLRTNITDETDDTLRTHTQTRVCFDFEVVGSKYPNRDGIKKAKEYFFKTVKTEQDFENIQKALTNYLESDQVKRGFIKNASTWFHNWQDWINFKGVNKNNGKTKEEIIDTANFFLEGLNND